MKKMSLISIIIPVFNAEKVLNRCVDAVISQSYQELEILLVNDGSRDNSAAICSDYAKKDPRVKVIDKINGGAGSARNAGIENAKGEYYCFLDADDLPSEEMIEKLYQRIRGMDSRQKIIAACRYQYMTDKDGTVTKKGESVSFGNATFSGKEALAQFIQDSSSGGGYWVAPWNKMFSAACWNDKRYPEGIIFEDEAITYSLLGDADCIVNIDDVLYSYFVKQPNSVMGQAKNKPKDHVKATYYGLQYLTAGNGTDEQLEIVATRVVYEVFWWSINLSDYCENVGAEVCTILQQCRKYKIRFYTQYDAVKIGMFCLFPRIFLIIKHRILKLFKRN